MLATITIDASKPRSLARELELDRLEHRAVRLDAVLSDLRRRARHHPAPHLIGRAIDELDAELADIRNVLRDVRGTS